MKQLVVFDLDGTLAESKSALDAEIAQLLEGLLGIVKVAVISGGAWQQFETQILTHLPSGESLKNLSLLPTCGTRFYRYRTGWELLYAEDLGGATSIDVTQRGIEKDYGIQKLRDVLRIEIAEMLFIGDAVFPGGNDYPAKQAGALSIRVRDPHETKRVIEAITACAK